MKIKEIEGRLMSRRYGISKNYGLILENEESVIADIRNCEGKVVIPYYNRIETEAVRRLTKIITEEGIPFRNKPRQSD